ncbi:(4S)-4-hydroxy-5-phosphonooxypentane-2,3-dione isomerase (plasmid) [Antarctobacter heliothermus]|uniref:(4S)-4-hydroxy-5-phosphonooxypentane-2,3-dione isomerase n=1 Tax=Antarctobacter heliothermus TaxID=74033 RepID=A0A222EAX5_9RHOB|nr:putative quinol monooxygenase [Antarctobacter heliothermus]ASP23349.1 (4S)-4-hydroxy-5-phosphonooxypentane-2,3-dione isomerase [Antarctobacter heliothermus]
MTLLHTAHLEVHAEVIDAFRTRLTRHAAITLEREDGCLRFDFFQDRDVPTRFLLIEVYADDAALAVHHEAPHYLEFRRDVAEWVTDRQWWFWDTPPAA